jgi:hypothetical protein
MPLGIKPDTHARFLYFKLFDIHSKRGSNPGKRCLAESCFRFFHLRISSLGYFHAICHFRLGNPLIFPPCAHKPFFFNNAFFNHLMWEI